MARHTDSFAVVVVGAVLLVALAAVLFVGSDFAYLGQNALGKSTTVADEFKEQEQLWYAPPVDPITGETYLSVRQAGTDQFLDLIVVAQGPERYIYHEGFYLKDGAWTQFTFNGERAGSWIRESASALIPRAPASGYVLAYVCKQYGGIFRCGVASKRQEPDDRKWTLAQYGPMCVDDARNLCATVQPQNATSVDGTCEAGSCYRCNDGKTVNRATGRCDNPAPTGQCLADARQLCAPSQPAHSTTGNGACLAGFCYRCDATYVANRTSGTCQQPAPQCQNPCTLGQKRCDPLYAFKAQECRIVNGCPQWYTYANCAMSSAQCVAGVCSQVAQNVKIASVTAIPGEILISYCKDRPGALAGAMTLTIAGHGGYTQSFEGIPIQDIMQCPDANYASSVQSSALWQDAAPGQSKTLTASIAGIQSQYDGISSDNTMTKSVTLQ